MVIHSYLMAINGPDRGIGAAPSWLAPEAPRIPLRAASGRIVGDGPGKPWSGAY